MVFVLEVNMIVNEEQILLLISHADFFYLILAIDYLLLSYFFTLTSIPYISKFTSMQKTNPKFINNLSHFQD